MDMLPVGLKTTLPGYDVGGHGSIQRSMRSQLIDLFTIRLRIGLPTQGLRPGAQETTV